MRQHRLADDIADREDVRAVGPHLLVDRDEAALVDLDACRIRPDHSPIRPPPDRDEHAIIGLCLLRCLLAFEADDDAVVVELERSDLGTQHDRRIPVGNALLQRPDEIAIATGHQRLGQLDNGNVDAERVVNGRHLEPDDAAADDEQALRQVVELERARRIDDPRGLGQAGDPARLRARGNDALAEADRRASSLAFHRQRVRVDKPRRAVHDLHLALPGQRAEAIGELLHDAALPVAQLVEIDRRLAEVDAELGRLPGLLDHARRVQQRLRRDAADVEADAAERRPALDQRDVHSEIGGAKSGRIAAGSRSDHNEIGFDGFAHARSLMELPRRDDRPAPASSLDV